MSVMSQPMRTLTSHDSEEWYTPPVYVELARSVLGGIDLDPASAPLPQTWIKAATYWTKAENGLTRPWQGRAYLNPPYGKLGSRSLMEVWTTRLEEEYRAGRVTAGIALINSTHGYAWYENLWRRWPVCLLTERVRFIDAAGRQGDQAKRGQTVVYFGPEFERFREVYRPFGRVLEPDMGTEPGTQGRLEMWEQ